MPLLIQRSFIFSSQGEVLAGMHKESRQRSILYGAVEKPRSIPADHGHWLPARTQPGLLCWHVPPQQDGSPCSWPPLAPVLHGNSSFPAGRCEGHDSRLILMIFHLISTEQVLCPQCPIRAFGFALPHLPW